MDRAEEAFDKWWRDYEPPQEWVMAWVTSDKSYDALIDFITDYGVDIFKAGQAAERVSIIGLLAQLQMSGAVHEQSLTAAIEIIRNQDVERG